MSQPKTAAIAGATGLVGQQCLVRLLKCSDYSRIIGVGRRASGLEPQEKLTELQVDFEQLPDPGAPLDDAYCCLGTTIKVAGSRPAFRKVDFDYVVAFAQWCLDNGAKTFTVISAVGSSASSPSFYSRVKGEMEAAVAELGFESTNIVRPSLLLGHREESRPAEELGQKLAPALNRLMCGPLAKYRAVTADEVADALIQLTLHTKPGVHHHHLPLR